MQKISLVTIKGGSGKTSLSASLAVAAGQAGKQVFLLDLDPQGSLAGWIERREAGTPGFDSVANGPALAGALEQIAGMGFDLCIMDTAGTASPLAVAAITASDLVLIPTRPSTLDMEATKPTIQAAMALGRPFAFILNQTPPRSARVSEAAAGLRLLGALCDPPITSRNAHQDAISVGMGVTEFEPDGKAAFEVRKLWKFIAKRISA
jgi:chromosome partitioning protein